MTCGQGLLPLPDASGAQPGTAALSCVPSTDNSDGASAPLSPVGDTGAVPFSPKCDVCGEPAVVILVGTDGFHAIARSEDGVLSVVCPVVRPVPDRHFCLMHATWLKEGQP